MKLMLKMIGVEFTKEEAAILHRALGESTYARRRTALGADASQVLGSLYDVLHDAEKLVSGEEDDD